MAAKTTKRNPAGQETFEFLESTSRKPAIESKFLKQLRQFTGFGQASVLSKTEITSPQNRSYTADAVTNEFWTSKQRASNSVHEISYRACFKPQLPRFFIERLTRPGDVVYDPFMGRGTTVIEAAIMGRVPYGNDINPLSLVLTAPRLAPPTRDQVEKRLREIDFQKPCEVREDLDVFYHPETLREICCLREYFLDREPDEIDQWIRMVAVNRLTGHSPGFFSVYSLPPNQAVSIQSQKRINEKRNQIPPRRIVPDIILKKSKQLMRDLDDSVRHKIHSVSGKARLFTQPVEQTAEIAPESVSLLVTSPPFLNVVQYATDNWLRCWFIGQDAKSIKITVPSNLETWRETMEKAFVEFLRILKPGGHVAFEVGEVNKGTVNLETIVVPCGLKAGFRPLVIMINAQEFTKTSNCWGVNNNEKGTNTNRIVVFQKPLSQ